MNITEIFQGAKEHLLRAGEHRPEVWAELAEAGICLVAFADFPFVKTVDKQKALFAVARKLGREHPGDELRQACLIMEAWTSQGKPGESRTYRFPSEDPNRKEHLVATILDIPAPKSIELSMYAAEIVRAGDVIDLLPYGKLNGKVRDNLLMAFLAGFLSAKLSDEEFASLIANTASQGGMQ